MANTEQIEAKLCAYVDGELDAAARAEIEQHLAANPQHRQLLAELVAQRDLLRELPREKAPEDLFDSFQTQLERSVLLDANRPAVSGRRNRSTQMMALAAILVLGIGLAAVIIFVLPDKGKHRDYAVLPATSAPAASDTFDTSATVAQPSAAPTTPTTSPAAPAGTGGFTALDSPAKSDTGRIRGESKSDIVASAAATPGSGGGQQNAVFGKAGAVDRKMDKNGADWQLQSLNGTVTLAPIEPEIAQRVTQSPQVSDNSMVVVVASANPTATDQQVTGYLAMNKIHWEDVSELMAQPVAAAKSETNASNAQASRMALGGGKDDGKNYEGQKAVDAVKAVKEPQTQATAAPAEPLKDSETVQQSVPAAAAASAAPTTRPSFAGGDVAAAHQNLETDKLAIDQQKLKQSSAPQSKYIVARGLTQSQVAELYTCIAAQNNGSVANYRRLNGAITPTTLPAALALQQQAATTQPGQVITFETSGEASRAIGGGGETQLRDKNSVATTSPTQVGGQIAGAASPTTALSPSTGTVIAQTSTPATQPALTPAGIATGALAGVNSPLAPTTAPTSQSVTVLLPQSLATTATTGPATSPGEERVDVVIVVKSSVPDQSNQINAAVAPSPPTAAPAAPATQPAPIMKARGR